MVEFCPALAVGSATRIGATDARFQRPVSAPVVRALDDLVSFIRYPA
jgi:hypothetical protein